MINVQTLHTPISLRKIINKPITSAEMSIVNNHVVLTLTFDNDTTIHAMSFYEEDNNILFDVYEPEYNRVVIKYTNDVGILNHGFINQYINSHPNFFTHVYVFEQVHFDNFMLPISPAMDDDGNALQLEDRFDSALNDNSPHYIEIIERVDGDLSKYPYDISIINIKAWSEQLWNMYSYMHMFNITYDDIKPNNIGYIIDGRAIRIKMIDLESLRKVNEDYTINPYQSGIFKSHKYYTMNTYLYDSVDILSMIFALFNAIYKNESFKYCDSTLSQLLDFDCSAIEKEFFNFSDNMFCSNWKFCLMMFTISWMTMFFKETQQRNYGLNTFYKFLVKNDIPDRFAWIIANIGLYIYMYTNGMLTLLREEGQNPVNITKLYNNYDIDIDTPVNSNIFDNIDKINAKNYKDVLAILRRDLQQVFTNYKEFVIKTMDYGSFKYLATCLYK